jgi:X-Pro dipeptidyl-peptidase
MDPVQRQGLVIDEQGFDTPAVFDLGFGLAPPVGLPPDPEALAHAAERLCPDVKIEHIRRGYSPEPDYDQFWLERDYAALGSKLAAKDGREIPMLVQGGWRDYNVKHSESVRMFRSVPVDRPETVTDEGVPYSMLVMGQGAHGGVDESIGFEKILHSWFDRYLYGFQTNIDRQQPSISMGNDGVLRRDASWPPPGTAATRLFLRSGGALSTRPPGKTEGSESYTDNGLTTESLALAVGGTPLADEAGVLWYVSESLRRQIRISGAPRLDLFAASDTASTHFTPVLFDLGPPVSTTRSLCAFLPPQQACTMSRGFLNARYRNGLGHGQDLVPGRRYRATVRFIDNDWVVKPGHRVGLAIMSSNLWWALPDQRRATNTVFHDEANPSVLVLPIVGGPAAARAAGL